MSLKSPQTIIGTLWCSLMKAATLSACAARILVASNTFPKIVCDVFLIYSFSLLSPCIMVPKSCLSCIDSPMVCRWLQATISSLPLTSSQKAPEMLPFVS